MSSRKTGWSMGMITEGTLTRLRWDEAASAGASLIARQGEERSFYPMPGRFLADDARL
jgi:hypothetical protein